MAITHEELLEQKRAEQARRTDARAGEREGAEGAVAPAQQTGFLSGNEMAALAASWDSTAA